MCVCLSLSPSLLLTYLLKYCISLSLSLSLSLSFSLQEIFPGTYEPSPCHKFVKLLEERGKLLRNYTQNIDTLEDSAGIKRVIYCHGERECMCVCVILNIIIIILLFLGSFSTATCTVCHCKVNIEKIREDIMNEVMTHTHTHYMYIYINLHVIIIHHFCINVSSCMCTLDTTQ